MSKYKSKLGWYRHKVISIWWSSNQVINIYIYIYIYIYIHTHIEVSSCPVGSGCRIHWLLLCRGVRPPPTNECPDYDTKQSDGEVPVMLELWEMLSTPSLLLLPGPFWPGVEALDMVLLLQAKKNQTVYLCKTELFEIELFSHLTELFQYLTVCEPKTIIILNWIIWNLILC